MPKIYVNHRSGNAVSGVWSYNDFGSVTAIGVVSADLKDDTNTPTGVSYSIAGNPFSAATGSSGNATAGVGEFTEEVLDYYNSFPIGSPPDLVFTGLPANASVSFTAAGYQTGQPSRDTTYTIGGSSATYDNDALASAPNPPVTVTGMADGSGSLTVDLSAAEAFGRINGFILEYTAPTGLTIDSTDASMQRNTNFQVVCSNPTTTPTTGNTTLTNGNDTLTTSSVTGSDPYTITFPVGDLTKQVDATGYDWVLEITPNDYVGDNPSGGLSGGSGLASWPADFTYVGAFRVPQGTFGAGSFSNDQYVNAQYQVMAHNPASNTMFLSATTGTATSAKLIGEITIPELVISESLTDLNTATVTRNLVDPSAGAFDALGTGGAIPSDEAKGILGGLHVYNNKLMGTAWSYYDASGGNGVRSHWTCNLDLTGFDGLHAVGTPPNGASANGGFVGGYLFDIPDQYVSSIGYDVASGRAGGPIVSRSSLGPSMFGFDPATFNGDTPATAQTFLAYPEPSILGGYDDTPSLTYNRATGIRGAVWPTNSDSVLFFGSHGLGIEMNPDGTPKASTVASEYGYGTSNADEAASAAEIVAAGVPHKCGNNTISVTDAQGGVACVFDPIDNSLTNHDYPFEFGQGHSLYGFGTNDWTEARTNAWLQANSPSGYQCGVTSMSSSSIAAGDACNYVGPAGSSAKGGGSYPTLYQVWQYNAADIIDVKNGVKTHDEIVPTIWNFDLPFIDPSKRKQLCATTYDSSSNTIYLLQAFADGNYPVIHAFTVGA